MQGGSFLPVRLVKRAYSRDVGLHRREPWAGEGPVITRNLERT